ncbi:hypothetical protein JMJ76_0012703, partial [Colletotrichum scovillei]
MPSSALRLFNFYWAQHKPNTNFEFATLRKVLETFCEQHQRDTKNVQTLYYIPPTLREMVNKLSRD